LTPRAGADRLIGVAATPAGSVVRAAVAAPAEAGRANAALVALLARACGVRRSAVAIVAGHKSRDKLVEVRGDPQALLPRLGALLAAAGQRR
jgi:uncharacterized protein YggU (UPF0235/DUF167 family)